MALVLVLYGGVHDSFNGDAAVRDEDVTVRIEALKVTESLHGNDGVGDGIIFRKLLLEKDLDPNF